MMCSQIIASVPADVTDERRVGGAMLGIAIQYALYSRPAPSADALRPISYSVSTRSGSANSQRLTFPQPATHHNTLVASHLLRATPNGN